MEAETDLLFLLRDGVRDWANRQNDAEAKGIARLAIDALLEVESWRLASRAKQANLIPDEVVELVPLHRRLPEVPK